MHVMKGNFISRFKCTPGLFLCSQLTHWGRVTHICVGELTIIGSDNGLSPGRRQAIIWTNAGILLIGCLGTNFSENLSVIQSFSFKKMHLKMSSAKWRPFCFGLNLLTPWFCIDSGNGLAWNKLIPEPMMTQLTDFYHNSCVTRP